MVAEQMRRSWLSTSIGLLLLTAGTCIFVWNEDRAAKIAHSLQEALNDVAVVRNALVPTHEFEGHLVYVTGSLKIAEPLTEPDYGVMVNSVKLKRRAQMYQWVEIEEDTSYVGPSPENKYYYYTTEWMDKLVDSGKFYIKSGHGNPSAMPIKSQTQVSDDVRIGNFALGAKLKQKFNRFVEITSDERPECDYIKMHSGLYYHDSDLWNPKVGDVRVQLSYAGKAGDVYTVIGKLVNGIIEPYTTSQGQEILLHKKHYVSLDQMFHLEHADNYWRAWILRALGWLVIFSSVTCLANIIKIIVQNSILSSVTIDIEYLSMSISISTSLLIIGLAWIWYKPTIGLVLACASVFPFMYSIMGSSPSSTASNKRKNYYRRL